MSAPTLPATSPALRRGSAPTGRIPRPGSTGSLAGTAAGLVLPRRLTAAAPSWERRADVLVVGSGVAGLSLVRGLASAGLDVLLATKGALEDGSTRWAQGGVATADGPGDDPELHLEDTLVAGAGLCDPEAVRVLVTEGPAAVRDLAAAGARFDGAEDGGPAARTLEGGHSRPRVVHAGGDATGAEVERALTAAARRAERVTVLEHAMLLELLLDDGGAVGGALVALLDDAGRPASTGLVRARATVLATGGWGQVFATTTNPAVATGDGLAAALRAGAATADLEFVQFHPTVLHVPSTPRGAGCSATARTLLVSEAVRGEGAVLVDAAGAPVMAGAHPLADLAPRDVVSARMAQVMAEQGVDHLYLDARGLGEATLLRRFPTIVAGCRAAGIDPLHEPVPVAPAAHYACGGVRADLAGRTSLPGLFAIGEVACTGVHGANRLASNSLLEGLVAGRRLAADLAAALPAPAGPRLAAAAPEGAATLVDPSWRGPLAAESARSAGVLRHPGGLGLLMHRFAAALAAPARGGRTDGRGDGTAPGRASWEATNLLTVGAAVAAAALSREESRGCHRRSDVPGPREAWRAHLGTTLDTGRLVQEVSR